MTGSHAASTRESAAASAATSGPIPAGSPAVIATRGFILVTAASATPRATASRAAAAGTTPRRIVAAALATAAAALNALGVGQFVAKTALQPPAQARELGGVEAQLLLLRHLDRHRLERLQERRAAERTAARAVAAVHLRLVSDTYLAHLDARPEL